MIDCTKNLSDTTQKIKVSLAEGRNNDRQCLSAPIIDYRLNLYVSGRSWDTCSIWDMSSC